VALLAKDPERELHELLAAQPAWRRKWLLRDYSWTADEISAWSSSNPQEDWLVYGDYEAILRRIPAKWRAYVKQLRRNGWSSLPGGNPPGRPRKDAIAEEARQLQSAQKSYRQIEIALRSKYGAGAPTAEAIRKLLASRRRQAPDKT
jgi:hypothetical protein